jgi:hypothetical protein
MYQKGPVLFHIGALGSFVVIRGFIAIIHFAIIICSEGLGRDDLSEIRMCLVPAETQVIALFFSVN